VFWPLWRWADLRFRRNFRAGVLQDRVLDGHLFGNLIDVINDGAPLMLVAIGMTMVIATGGIDLSVGAVIAISAALATVLINPALGNSLITNDILTKDATNTPLPIIVLVCLAAGTLCGLWNGLLVSRARIQPMIATLVLMVPVVASPAHHERQIMTSITPLLLVWQRVHRRVPVSIYIVAIVLVLAWLGSRRTSVGLFVESVGINAKSTFYSVSATKTSSYWSTLFRLLRRCRRVDLSRTSTVRMPITSASATNWMRSVRGVGGTLMSGGRFSLVASAIGALVIWAFTISMYTIGVPARLYWRQGGARADRDCAYSDFARRFMNRLFERKGSQHGAAD